MHDITVTGDCYGSRVWCNTCEHELTETCRELQIGQVHEAINNHQRRFEDSGEWMGAPVG